jgi:hypothetical protein
MVRLSGSTDTEDFPQIGMGVMIFRFRPTLPLALQIMTQNRHQVHLTSSGVDCRNIDIGNPAEALKKVSRHASGAPLGSGRRGGGCL